MHPAHLPKHTQPNTQADDPSSLIAHQTQIHGEVGGTHHIEPNDTPRAGESVTAWFALVQAGGDAIPLADCDCALALYSSPYRAGDQAIATPPLKAITVEGQTDVPASDFIFPQLGAYELIIRGTPRGTATFSPFELQFPITVAAGQAAPSTVEPTKTSAPGQTETGQTEASQTGMNTSPALPTGGIVGLGAIALLVMTVLMTVLAIARLTRKR